MRVLAGTSGFSYDEWRGPFYPQELPGDGMLAYYAGQLPAVEINNTFYRMPSRKVLAGWAEAVPEAFRFALKASRKITHFKKLREVGDDVAYLVEVSATLGARRGPLLFQLPPWLKKDLPLLRDFLDALPAGVAAALEVRSDSWHD
ncbi:MAG TPA: DUF72 domain-containing protein, partial [Thermoanaerobaculia bacterium]|nr:DUF72 domain-containing protein [Thermoanaerobaculia bacterium]